MDWVGIAGGRKEGLAYRYIQVIKSSCTDRSRQAGRGLGDLLAYAEGVFRQGEELGQAGAGVWGRRGEESAK